MCVDLVSVVTGKKKIHVHLPLQLLQKKILIVKYLDYMGKNRKWRFNNKEQLITSRKVEVCGVLTFRTCF